ncbi:hypothetical protein FNV43_RR20555 [Rhamnella rubrinervis]|uniref:Cytochrome P450 n=1 Tax=Rhamnella rubrinervis TaxID=2594499 RepID=A0A8K0GTH7_9ROSA|nr:hypothetical protein FNV43_RR20555 [Rhamnella rubrinervis]
MWLVSVIGLSLLLWWWNEFWYVFPLKLRRLATGTGAELPPGHMGFPIIGEMLTFIWYFKILRRPDEFINYKRKKYGDAEGMYRTHLFGSPSIIAYLPPINKFVLHTDDAFTIKWPNVELIGRTSLGAVDGKYHARLRSFVSNAFNRPKALRCVALQVQPRMVAALDSWAQKGTIIAYVETRKVTFENIGKLFVSFEPGPLLEPMFKLFKGVIQGIRTQPLNIPGSASYHGRQVIDNIITLVIGGYESTTLAKMWAMYCLAKYPKVLEKLREENMSVSKNKEGDILTYDDISKLKYTSKVVEETIRMANVASLSFRMATKDVEYKGYKIPKNWNVILWLRYLHTNPENFEDPMCFNPDRWNEPPKPGTYLVFGGGSRLCAGNMLARIQLSLFLHYLSTGYKWKLVNPDAQMIYLSHHKPADGVEVEFSKI